MAPKEGPAMKKLSQPVKQALLIAAIMAAAYVCFMLAFFNAVE